MFYDTDKIKIYNGNSKDILKQLDDKIIDLTVTSPPYDNLRKYNGFDFNFEEIANELYRVTKDGGIIVWIVNDGVINGSETGTSFKQALYFKEIGFNLYDTMIWQKPSPATPTEGRYYDVFEYMFIISKGKPKTLNLLEDRKNITAGNNLFYEPKINKEERKTTEKTRTVKEYSRRFNIWNIARGKNETIHPAVFPEKLAFDHILSWSNENDLVLDPFMGSGTTALACLKANRRCIGIEISKEYCEIIKQRCSQESYLF